MKLKPILLTALGAVLLALTPIAHAQSGSVDTTFMRRVGPDGAVNAVVAQTNGMVVFGGAFTNVNFTPFNHLARADTNGDADASFAIGTGPDAAVNALALQGDGKLLVAGAFTNFNGVARHRLVRVNGNGSVDSSLNTGAGADGPVNFVAWQASGQVLIQGAFANFNGIPRLGLARLNANGSLDTAFDPGDRAANVSALAWQADGKVVFSGNFTSLDGVAATNLARLNADGSLDTNFCAAASLNAAAWSLAVQSDGRLLLSGSFTSVNGVARGHVARLNTDGTLDTSFDPGTGFAGPAGPHGMAQRVYLALQPDGNTLAWGTFTSFNGTNRNGAARLTSSGGLDTTFDPGWGVSGWTGPLYAKSVAFLTGGYFITGGSSSSFGYLTRRNPDGTRDGWMSEFGPDAGVWTAIEQSDGKLLIGGNFSTFHGVLHRGIVRLNPDGSLDTNFLSSAGVNEGEEVYTLLPQPDGNILVGGWFMHFNGVLRTNLARLHADGSLDTNFNGSVDGWGWPMALQPDGKIIVGGSFGYADGVARNNIARFNSDGSLDTSFDPGAGADNWTEAILVQPDGKILVGGIFGWFANVFGGIVRLNPNGTVDPVFTNNCTGIGAEDWFGAVNAFALQPDGKILAAGCFDDFNHAARTNLVRLKPDGSLDATFVPAPLAWQTVAGQIYGLALQPDGKMVIGYWPSNIVAGASGVPAGGPCVARLNPDGSLDSSFQIGACSAGGIWCMTRLSNGQIMIGGDFPDFNNVATPRLARLHGDEAITIAPFSLGLHWNSSQLELGLFGEAGRTYTIEAATSLPQFTAWTNVTSTGTNWLPVPVQPAQFFRARTGP